VRITGRGARAAIATSSSRPTSGAETAARSRLPASNDEVIRERRLVNEPRIGLEKALVRFPARAGAQTELRRALEEVSAIRQIIELQRDGELVVMVVFAGPAERAALQAQFSELVETRTWDDILDETHVAALGLWRERARRAATEEELLSISKRSDSRGPTAQSSGLVRAACESLGGLCPQGRELARVKVRGPRSRFRSGLRGR
jgi:hypothetical protein